MIGEKSSFLLIFFFNLNIGVASMNVKFDKDLSALQLVNNNISEKQRMLIWNSDIIEFLIVLKSI